MNSPRAPNAHRKTNNLTVGSVLRDIPWSALVLPKMNIPGSTCIGNLILESFHTDRGRRRLSFCQVKDAARKTNKLANTYKCSQSQGHVKNGLSL